MCSVDVTSVFLFAASHSQSKWRSAQDEDLSETAVFIEPPEGAVTRVSLRLMCHHPICQHTSRNNDNDETDVSSVPPPPDPERGPGSDADAPGGLLLATAHAAALQPLSAHRARPAADVSGRVSLRKRLPSATLTRRRAGREKEKVAQA